MCMVAGPPYAADKLVSGLNTKASFTQSQTYSSVSPKINVPFLYCRKCVLSTIDKPNINYSVLAFSLRHLTAYRLEQV